MATYTPHYNLKKPATSDKIRVADFNGNADTIDTTMYDNASLIAKLKADIGIVENTNTATHNIAAGQYVIWNGSIYTASSAISSGATLSNANLTDVSGGGLNALINKMPWTRVGNGVTTVTLTSVPNSLIAYVYKSGTTNYIPIFVDTDNNGYYRGGQYFGSNSGFAATVLWNKSTMKLDVSQFFENGTDVTSSAIMRVYIK